MTKLFIEDLLIRDKKILMRVDFNVPLDADLNVIDATRIEASLPSIRYVLKNGGALILMSHLGRPHNMPSKAFSLAPCAKVLSAILNQNVIMAHDCIGHQVEEMVKKLNPKEILLLENLRFHRGEEYPEEDPDFAKKLASYGNCYINDAFGTAHRKHSSTYTIAGYFPGNAAAGYLLEKEIRFLGNTINNPNRPFHTIVGGAKVSSKIGVLKSILAKVDTLLIGGGMAYTFLQAQGKNVGNSLVEKDFIPMAKEILFEAKERGVNLLLPEDAVIASQCSNTAPSRVVSMDEGIPEGFQGYDIGPRTIQSFNRCLEQAKTVLWNGPVGVYEVDSFAKGSFAIAKIMSQLKALTIVGGGDSIAIVNAAEVADKISHISTGGGATLEYIEYGTLPGIEALSEKGLVNINAPKEEF